MKKNTHKVILEMATTLSELRKKNGVNAFTAAQILESFLSESDLDPEIACSLAERITKIQDSTLDARFTDYDYADSFINYPDKLDAEKLLALSDSDFAKVFLCMAERKRETYSSDPEIVDDRTRERLLAQIRAEEK